jgi:hypothetical protein
MPILTLRQFLATTFLAITLIDTCGETPPGDFLSEDGRYLGNDGLSDHRLYVVRTTDTVTFDGVPYAGIDVFTANRVERFIHSHVGDSTQFLKNRWIYDNVIAIDSVDGARREMIRWVSQDDNRQDTEARHNREYGGFVSNEYRVAHRSTGPVSYPPDSAEISLTSYGKEPEEFHSHPSGMKNGKGYTQPPSFRDWKSVGDRLGYVFAIREKIIYIYDRRGVLAKLPIDRFVN